MKDHRITDSCPLAWDWIERSVDGTLGAAEGQRLREHLRGCADCAGLHDDAVAVRGLIRSVPRPVCPARAVDAVLERIAGDDGRLHRSRAWLPWRSASHAARASLGGRTRPVPLPGWARIGLALAAAAVLLLVAPSLLRRGQPDPERTVAQRPPRSARPDTPAVGSLTAEQQAQAEAAVAQARLALGVLARTLDRTSDMAEQHMRSSIGTSLRRALEPRRRPQKQSQEPDRRTGVLPGAAWMTGKC